VEKATIESTQLTLRYKFYFPLHLCGMTESSESGRTCKLEVTERETFPVRVFIK